MSEPTTIATVDDEYLCQMIRGVKKRLVFMTPGTSEDVANEICQKWNDLPKKA